jgi:pimeloyl-ACP methyl ester carboxylesterase
LVFQAGYLADDTAFQFIRSDLEKFLLKQKISAPVFLCHSLGCFVGLSRASFTPQSIVIAINMPPTPWRGLLRGTLFATQILVRLLTQGLAKARLYADAQIYFGRSSLNSQQLVLMQKIESETHRYFAPRCQDLFLFVRSILCELGKTGELAPRILVIEGLNDPLVPTEDQARVRARLPHASILSLDGGHVLPLGNAPGVVSAIASFLAMPQSHPEEGAAPL